VVPTRLGRRAGTEIVSEIVSEIGTPPKWSRLVSAVGPVPGALDPQSVGGWTSRPLAVGLGPTGGLALFAGVTARAGPPAAPPRCLRYHRSNLTSGVSNVYPPRVRPRARVRGPSAHPRGPRRGDQ
jgi:hypothetical protein